MVRQVDDQTVVVGVDGSVESVDALRYAVQAAHSRHMWLLVVHAFQLPPSATSLGAETLSAAAHGAARGVTADALSQVRIPSDLSVDAAVTLTTPLVMLQRLSEHAAMIVLGQHVFDPSQRAFAGLTAASVAATSLCPVITIPRGWGWNRLHARSIHVGLDGHTAADVVLWFAFDEAERRGWPIVVFQAAPRNEGDGDQPDESMNLEETLVGQKKNHPDVSVSVLLMLRDLPQVVLEGSRQARLLVLGRPRSYSPLDAWPRSFAGEVLASALCPIAVVPPGLNGTRE